MDEQSAPKTQAIPDGWRTLPAAVCWALLCIRWFDVTAPWRPGWLAAIPAWALALLLAASLALILGQRWRDLGRSVVVSRELWLMVGLAVAFRLPLAWTAAVGYTASDGSLSGIVAMRIRDGIEHLVFVPHVPYSGSLKSHLAAALALVVDLQRAFTLSSVLFYGLFVGSVYGLAAMLGGRERPHLARLAALYVVFSPLYVTRYSLSNDGNYVEVLALGTLSLLLAARSLRGPARERDALALGAGLCLGLAFWCHILAVIQATAVVMVMVGGRPRSSLRTLPRLGAGFVLGDLPGLLWNAGHRWESFVYLLPGAQPVGSLASGPTWPRRLAGMVSDGWPVLVGYDPGQTGLRRALFVAFAAIALAAVAVAFGVAIRRFRVARDPVRGTLLLATAVNLLLAASALPYIPGNPRYLLFLTAPIAVFLADTFGEGRRRWLLGLLLAGGALGSLAQWPDAARSDRNWRAFVAELPGIGVRRCYTDFFLAAKVNLVAEERVICSSELGPTTTEYFEEYPRLLAQAPSAALVAVNRTAGDKLERKLQRLGAAYERWDLMKPVILPAKKMTPDRLFGSPGE